MKGLKLIPGWRNVKTAVAVMICFVIFLPWWGGAASDSRTLGPFYACIAAIICMQGSVEASVKQGLSRLLGTLVGGLVGLAGVSLTLVSPNYVVTTLIFGLCVMAAIYICTILHQPKACSIAAVVCCAVILSHSGEDRYFYTVARMAETAVGIVVAVAVNRVLPSPQRREELEQAITEQVKRELETEPLDELERREKECVDELQQTCSEGNENEDKPK